MARCSAICLSALVATWLALAPRAGFAQSPAQANRRTEISPEHLISQGNSAAQGNLATPRHDPFPSQMTPPRNTPQDAGADSARAAPAASPRYADSAAAAASWNAPAEPAPANAAEPGLALPPPSGRAAGHGKPAAKPGGAASMFTTLGGLSLVLALFIGLTWMVRKANPRAATKLPGEVVESLGVTALNARQQLQLVRFGSKLLLVAVTAGGAQTLSEICDPEEVDRLAGLCHQHSARGVSANFRGVFAQLGAASSRRRASDEEEVDHDA